MKWVAAILAVAAVLGAGVYGFTHLPQMDPLMTRSRLARIQASPHYKNGEFVPETPHVAVTPDKSSMWPLLRPTKGIHMPKDVMPAVKTDLKSLDPKEDVVVWLGHSSFYVQLGGEKILIDPILTTYASPVPFIIKAYPGTELYTAEDIPDDIDVMVLSHDHWDHLDYDLVRAIEPKVRHVVTGLGNGGYYEKWGYPLSKIHEEDWYTPVKLGDNFTVWVMPTRHFSGRMLHRNQTLYAGFVIESGGKRLFYSGDGGYDDRFARIGKQFGGFDLAIMEDGQYNEIGWPSVHMLLEESAKGAEELHAKVVIPCHNSKYTLAPHTWKDPLERFAAASQGKSYKLATPKIGEAVRPFDPKQTYEKWWETLE